MDLAIAANLHAARNELEAARLRLTERIRGYPQPVGHGDDDYLFLLAERRRVMVALGALSAEMPIPEPRLPG